MATVNKNFRIKNGLVVEGSTATVNGQNVLTETGGDAYILNLVGGASLVKSVSSDFTVTGGGELQVNNSSDLARTGDIASALADYTTTANLDTTIDGYGYLKSADLSGYATESYVNTAIGNIDLSYTTDDVTEGTNLYFTNQRALDATSAAYDAAGAAATAQSNAEDYADGLAGNYDPAGAALTAEGNANTYTDNAINALDTDDISEGAANQYFTNTRARNAISGGTGISYDSNSGAISVDNTVATTSYVDTAVSNLIDGAPGLLDTLNEIAAAINDDANYFTTIANSIAAKQDTLTASTGITIDGSNNISVTANTYDAYGAASTAQTNAEGYADGLIDDLQDGTTPFTVINVNDEAKQIAASTSSLGSVVATAYQWAKADYRSGKFLVKIDNGTNNEISEILLTLDSSDNVAITEYAVVSTNGSRGTITADISGSNVRVRVNPVNDSTIKITGTLLK